MIKSHKIRIYPNKEQECLLWKHIGACRFIWNYMLDYQEKLYKAGEKHLSAFSMMKLLKPLKNDGEHGWLYEVSNASLKRCCQDLSEAYQRFFKKKSGFPKYKSRKRSKTAYPVRESVYFKDGKAVIEKIGKVKYKTDLNLPEGKGNKFSNPRITFRNGKWFLSFGIEYENQVFELTDYNMGIDLGLKDLAIAECNGMIVFHNINKSKRMRNLNLKKKHLQRSISRKYEANKRGNKFVKTNNIIREEQKLRDICARIADIRNNYIHQCTHKLVSMLPKQVVMEDLNVSGIMKNRHLSRAIQEQCLYEFIRQMKYKCEWRGIKFLQADRFYPSSKICSCCGSIKRDLRLSDRIYHCEKCGAAIDRDYNAAINLSRYAA